MVNRIFTRDDVVGQRLGFGRWYFFIGVTNWHVFFNFPVSRALGTRLKRRPEKLCDSVGCNFESRASQVGLNTNRQRRRRAKFKVKSIEETRRERTDCTYRTNPFTRQLSNSVQNSPYIHQHIPRKRLQASSCYPKNWWVMVSFFARTLT